MEHYHVTINKDCTYRAILINMD